MENSTTTLTDTQEHVLAQISGGSTIRSAASAAGIHRNTVAYWLHKSPAFHQAFDEAQTTRALLKRSEAEDRLETAYAAIDRILANPEAPPGVILRAALAIIDRAAAPLAHPAPEPPPPTVTTPPQPATVTPLATHHPSPITQAKPGRNDLCPCGSGRKFKRCCLGQLPPPVPRMPPSPA